MYRNGDTKSEEVDSQYLVSLRKILRAAMETRDELGRETRETPPKSCLIWGPKDLKILILKRHTSRVLNLYKISHIF